MASPNYVASRTAWNAVNWFRVLFFWLIIPLIIMIVGIIENKKNKIEFYDNYIIEKSGILSKKEKKSVFAGVCSVSVSQSIWGRICNYGDVHVDVVGQRWSINTEGISRPNELKEYIDSKIIEPSSAQKVFVV